MSDNNGSISQGSQEGEENVSSSHIQIKVVGQNSEEMKFNIKKTTKLGKLMTKFCEGALIVKAGTRFLYDGSRVLDHNTPKELGMEDGDVIEMYTEQRGGN